jgi:hypothetical protein
VQPVVPAEVEEDEGIRPVYWRQQIWVMLRRHLAATSRHSTSSELPGTIPTGAHRLSSVGLFSPAIPWRLSDLCIGPTACVSLGQPVSEGSRSHRAAADREPKTTTTHSRVRVVRSNWPASEDSLSIGVDRMQRSFEPMQRR